MIVALVTAVASIVGGSALGLIPTQNSRVLGSIRTFGLTASASVVLFHLLPEVYQVAGGLTLIVFVAALLAPSVLRPLLRAFTAQASDRNAEWVTLRITYVGLWVHSVADGIALGAYSGGLDPGTVHYDVLIALSAHTVPVVAVMTLTFRDFRGLGLALFGALGLLIATSLGVVVAGLVPQQVVHGASAWVGAIVAGLLLHVVTHDLGGHAPERPLERLLDLSSAAAGVGVGLLSGDAHSHLEAARGMGPTLANALGQITLAAAPLLLLGLFVAALLQTLGSRQAFGSVEPGPWFLSRGALRDLGKGALVGGLLPRAAARVLPLSKVLHEGQAAPALVVAFLLVTPQLGVETFALSAGFLGWELSWLRLVAAFLVAFSAALLLTRIPSGTPHSSSPPVCLVPAMSHEGSLPKRVLVAFDDLLQQVGAWMVLGIIAAAFVEALVPAGAFRSPGSPLLELGVVTLLTLPAHISAPAAMPLAGVLMSKGLSPGAVMLGLCLGPAYNLATLSFLRGAYGVRVAALVSVAVVLTSWGLALLVDGWLAASPVHGAGRVAHSEAPWSWPLTLVFGALMLRSLWRSGTRAWFGSVLQGDAQSSPEQRASERGHAHGHAHGF